MATSKDKSSDVSGSAAARADDPFDFASGWRPEPGNTVTGKVESLDMGENQYGPYPIVTLLQDNGERIALHAFHTVFRNALKRARPMPGNRMAVRYVGLVEEDRKGRKLDNAYHGYQVRMLDQDASSFWGPAEPSEPVSQFNDEPPF